jgi:uridine phosphorylase
VSGTAEDPWFNGRPPHIPAELGQLPRVCLLPGDPARVSMVADLLEDFTELGFRREFRLATGTYRGVKVAICSTGIGGPSTEIAVVELSRLGVDTFVRVGGMGAMTDAVAPGDLTLVERALRDSGAARFYAADCEDIAAHPDVIDALHRAAAHRDTRLHPISVLSCDSYYVGEGRPLAGLEAAAAARMDEVQRRKPDAMDMECETVFAVARALGRRFGAVLATHGHRATNAWLEDYEPVQRQMLALAIEAAAELAQDDFA